MGAVGGAIERVGSNAVREYAAVIARVARTAAPVAVRADWRAYTQDDYQQELALCAVQTRFRFRERHGFCTPHERKYVYKALWNCLHDMQVVNQRWRTIALENEQQEQVTLAALGEGEDPELRYYAREKLRVIFENLDSDDLRLLQRLWAAGGDIPRAHRPELDGSLSTFRRRVGALRARVRELID